MKNLPRSIDAGWDKDEVFAQRLGNGTTIYRNASGVIHREDGPAIEYGNGDKAWSRDGVLHRSDGPAFISRAGSEIWINKGEAYRSTTAPDELRGFPRTNDIDALNEFVAGFRTDDTHAWYVHNSPTSGKAWQAKHDGKIVDASAIKKLRLS